MLSRKNKSSNAWWFPRRNFWRCSGCALSLTAPLKTDNAAIFQYNKFKRYLIETKVPDGTSTTVYRCGTMIDLCVGPHIPHTGKIKAFMITKSSASYFLGDSNNESLQRIYGISFPDKKQLAEYKVFLAEAAKRDHRKIGKVRFGLVNPRCFVSHPL